MEDSQIKALPYRLVKGSLFAYMLMSADAVRFVESVEQGASEEDDGWTDDE